MNDLNILLKLDIQVALNSYIEILGNAVFDVENIEEDCAKYKVNGFENPQFFICDYRKNSLEAIKSSLLSRRFDEFHDKFNRPALVKIRQLDDKNFIIELSDTKKSNPMYKLWIAAGITEKELHIREDISVLIKEIATMKKKRSVILIYSA